MNVDDSTTVSVERIRVIHHLCSVVGLSVWCIAHSVSCVVDQGLGVDDTTAVRVV